MQFLQRTISKHTLLWSASLALFWVIFLWGFFDKGSYAFGINTTVFFVLVLFYFNTFFQKNIPFWHAQNRMWSIPFMLIALGFLLYGSPVMGGIGLLVILLLCVFAGTYTMLEKPDTPLGRLFVSAGITRALEWIGSLGESLKAYSSVITGERSSHTHRRIAIGVALCLVLVFGVVMPMLSATDPHFASLVAPLMDFLQRIIDTETLLKIIVGLGIAVGAAAIAHAWQKKIVLPATGNKSEDSIIAGIVIGGIFVVYVVFLAIQLQRLWVAELPISFSETEVLVKSGFWQLLFLSIINILIFLATFARTNTVVQRLLSAFTIASLLLVFSAAWRMVLYITYYGFSYEKLFASYTVLFCIILFGWFVVQVVRAKQSDVIRFGIFLFFWMFAVLAVLPAEHIIIRSNLALSQKQDSRIELYEMTMLSTDVLGYVEKRLDDPRFENWNNWVEDRKEEVAEKSWFEWSVSDVWYKLGNK